MANPNPYLELVTDNDGQGAASDNPYTPLLQADTAQKVRSSVSSVIDINPDVDAKLQQLAKRYGVPLDAVRLDPKSLERKQELESIDYAELARKAPGTANFMADPQAAAIARDDVENMSMIESLWKEAKQFGTTVSNAVARGWQSQQRKWTTNAFNVNARTVQDVDRIEQMLADGADPNTFNVENDPLGLAQMTREERAKLRSDALELAKQGAQEISIKTNNMAAIPRPAVTERVMNADKVVDPVATFYSGETVYAENLKGWEAFKATAAEFVKSPASFIADVGLESLVGNLDAMALAIPASMVGGPALGAATMGIGSYNTAYATAFLDNLESQGVDIRDPDKLAEAVKNPEMMDQARKTAHVYASILSSFDAASMGVASKVALPKSLQIALKDKAFAKELTNMLIVQPQLQGTLGVVGEVAASSAVGKEVGTGELFGEFFGEMLGTPIEVLTASGRRIYGDFVKVDAAEESAKRLQKLNDLATASKIRSRDVDTFESFVASVTADGPIKEVFVDAQTLAQSGIAAQLAEVSPSVAEQFEFALTAGTQISIPVAEYTARIAGTELNQSLLPHLRTEANGFSQVEAQEYMQSFAQELKADVERTLAIRKSDEEFKAQVESVKTNIKTQLDSTGRFTPQVNDAYAAMIGNFYAVTASKLGISPDELLQRYPLRVQAQSPVGGQQYEQGAFGPRFEQFKGDAKGAIEHLKQQKSGEAIGALSHPDLGEIDLVYGEEGTNQSNGYGLAKLLKYHPEVVDNLQEILSEMTVVFKSDTRAQLESKDHRAGVRLQWDGNTKQWLLTAFKKTGAGEGTRTDTTQLKSVDDTASHTTDPETIVDQKLKQFYQQANRKGELNQSAWHGSPYRFTKFSLDHMGKGEGAQAFGWGLYFASLKDVAKTYTPREPAIEAKMMAAYQKAERAQNYNAMEVWERAMMYEDAEDIVAYYTDPENGYDASMIRTAKSVAKQVKTILSKSKGQIYEVNIPEDSEMLLWDKPLSEQPETVRAALAKYDPEMYSPEGEDYDANETGAMIYHRLAEKMAKPDLAPGWDSVSTDSDGRAWSGQEGASKLLNDLGIKGIKYLDGGSRGAGDGSFNYVVFDDKAVEILNTYYQSNQTANRGSFNPATNTITLLKNADLSTFLHESGHFFLETQFDIAARIAQESAMFGNTSNKPGEQQILEDTNAILKWFGIRDLNEWNSLDFEEKRSYHEKFARGFEAYLFEGKAPSIEVQGIFQRFRAWMINVYKELKNLNVELNDEVRQVFDRMLATDEQIELAKQGRSMMELFATAQQAGMTADEFAAYQAVGVDATNDAIQDLQARGLRDLAWSRNARGREIKRLQKQAAARRAEVTIDVRREVMSQPIYRAWQFLTGKLSAEDKIAPQALPKSDPNVVDETIDSLFTAIAKLGGLDRAEVESQWGFDPKERSPMPAFGKYTLRREGGFSIDAMAEMLAERGYLELDENGRFDQRELEEKFDAELRGDIQYSTAVDERIIRGEGMAGEGLNLEALGAGRFDAIELSSMGLPENIIEIITNLKMTAKNGLHPDLVAELFGFTSGDELIRTLAIAQEPKQEINDLVDARMLELYGELATPEAIEREADKAIHNENRARVVATEANALAKATGQRKVLVPAAKAFAREMINRLKIRDIRPGQYAAAEVRAAKAAEKASQSGDLATAAAEKRNQLVNTFATREAYDAQEKVEAGVRYLKKFDSEGTRKNLDADYLDQIDALLERFDLRKMTNKAMDKRTALASWLKSQEEQGLVPEIPEDLQNEALRKPYKEMTVEEFSGLVDSVKQIEHLGRLKNRLLTAANNRAFAAVRDEISSSIEANAGDRQANTRTPTTNAGRMWASLKNFYASHIKAATWARVMDGGMDGGPVWEYLVRPANERGEMETTMRAQATTRLSEIMAPVFKLGKMGGKGMFFPSIGRSLNRQERMAIALNTGNEGNLQRLLGGEGWTPAQIQPVLESLTSTEWKAVQEIWDHFESYRPEIAAKERRVYGKEPAWVEPTPFEIRTADGETVYLRGGYYPIKYDPAASQRAEEYADAEGAKRQLQGAFTSATTRRSFTKTRSEEIVGRPLLYNLSGLYSGVNDVIHDLAWHEWLIDANRLLRSSKIDQAMRERYGPEAKAQFKTWVSDIAEGETGMSNAGEIALSRLRQGVSAAGLGFNVVSAAMQVLGFTQSIVRVGPTWVGRGIAKYVANPLRTVREVNAMSDFMANRSRTQFRELNELRNRVQDETALGRAAKAGAFYLMMRAQQMVDVPTWYGAYEKALAAGQSDERSIQLADQAVIDAQGNGQIKDLSAIERGGPALKLFTVFYSFMNTAFNLGVAQTMTANTPAKKAKLAADYLLLYSVPAVLGSMMKEALTPGGGDEDWDKLAKKLVAEQLSYLMGMMVVVREFGEVAKIVSGAEGVRGYQGPAGVRLISDTIKFTQQAKQGEFDDAFRKAAINLIGDFTGLPAAQVNRTITGVQALSEGETKNPAAVLFGFDRN